MFNNMKYLNEFEEMNISKKQDIENAMFDDYLRDLKYDSLLEDIDKLNTDMFYDMHGDLELKLLINTDRKYLTTKEVIRFINIFQSKRVKKIRKCKEALDNGRIDAVMYSFLKEDNFVGMPTRFGWAKDISDTHAIGLMGKGMEYKSNKYDSISLETLNRIRDINRFREVEFDMINDAARLGVSTAKISRTDEGSYTINTINPERAFCIFDANNNKQDLFGVEFFTANEVIDEKEVEKHYIYVYSDEYVQEFTMIEDGEINNKIYINDLGINPIVEYSNNSYYNSDFFTSIGIINVFDSLLTRLTDALSSQERTSVLHLTDVGRTDKDIQEEVSRLLKIDREKYKNEYNEEIDPTVLEQRRKEYLERLNMENQTLARKSINNQTLISNSKLLVDKDGNSHLVTPNAEMVVDDDSGGKLIDVSRVLSTISTLLGDKTGVGRSLESTSHATSGEAIKQTEQGKVEQIRNMKEKYAESAFLNISDKIFKLIENDTGQVFTGDDNPRSLRVNFNLGSENASAILYDNVRKLASILPISDKTLYTMLNLDADEEESRLEEENEVYGKRYDYVDEEDENKYISRDTLKEDKNKEEDEESNKEEKGD